MKRISLNKSIVGFIGVLLLFIMPCTVYPAVPQVVNYQGYLTDSGGTPVTTPVGIDLFMTFSIYDAATEGAAVWTETHTVSVNNGIYSVVIGSVDPTGNPLDLPFNTQYYLGVTAGTDQEMTPRQALTSVPTALNADTVDGLHGNAFAPDVHVHAGSDINSGRIILSGSSSVSGIITAHNTVDSGKGLQGSSSGLTGMGVYGLASYNGPFANYGGYFTAEGGRGRGVYGEATYIGDDINYGGYFMAYSRQGRGVFGYSGSAVGTNYGGYFTAEGITARGVYGEALHTGDDINYGGYFEAAGKKARGVYGRANNGSGTTNYGGYFEADGSEGIGVHGSASSTGGKGMYGYASNSGDVTNYGGYFESKGRTGQAVYGLASGTSTLPDFSKNYGGYFEARGTHGKAVYGVATFEGSTNNYGGFFEAHSELGAGVYGKGYGKYGYGLKGVASGENGRGVYGSAGTGIAAFFHSNSGYGLIVDQGYAGFGTDEPNGPVHIQSTLNINEDSNFTNRTAPIVVGDGDGTGVTLLIDGNQIEQTNSDNSLYLNNNSPSNVVMVMGGGKVGIGRNIPSADLHINTGSFLLGTSSAKQLRFRDTGGAVDIESLGVPLYINNSSGQETYLMGGDVGIGETTPSEKLHVAGNIYATGSITPGSSRELKENIRELSADEAIKALNNLYPQKFYYKADNEDEHVGFIAEDVPELLATKDRKGVSSMDVVAVLTKVVQEQQRVVEEQRNVNQQQQKIIAGLEKEMNELKRVMKLKGSLASVMN